MIIFLSKNNYTLFIFLQDKQTQNIQSKSTNQAIWITWKHWKIFKVNSDGHGLITTRPPTIVAPHFATNLLICHRHKSLLSFHFLVYGFIFQFVTWLSFFTTMTFFFLYHNHKVIMIILFFFSLISLIFCLS